VLRNVGLLRLRDGSVTVNFEDHGDYVPVPLLIETSVRASAADDGKQAVAEVFEERSVLVFRGLAHYGALATVLQRNSDDGPGAHSLQRSPHARLAFRNGCRCVSRGGCAVSR
jgi:hypothetical protein